MIGAIQRKSKSRWTRRASAWGCREVMLGRWFKLQVAGGDASDRRSSHEVFSGNCDLNGCFNHACACNRSRKPLPCISQTCRHEQRSSHHLFAQTSSELARPCRASILAVALSFVPVIYSPVSEPCPTSSSHWPSMNLPAVHSGAVADVSW